MTEETTAKTTLPTTFEKLQARCRHVYVQPCCGRKKCQANYTPCAEENCPGFGDNPVDMKKLVSDGASS